MTPKETLAEGKTPDEAEEARVRDSELFEAGYKQGMKVTLAEGIREVGLREDMNNALVMLAEGYDPQLQEMGVKPREEAIKYLQRGLDLPPSKAEDKAKALLELLKTSKMVDFYLAKKRTKGTAFDLLTDVLQTCKETGL